jgi:hypothetical protein
MNTSTNSQKPATGVGSSVLLADRIGFTFYPRGSREETRIRDEIHRLRVQRQISESRLALSECEAERLCKCMPRQRYLMAKAQMAQVGSVRACYLTTMARIAQQWDGLCFRLNRTLCIGAILLLRLGRRLQSFLRLGGSYKRDIHANVKAVYPPCPDAQASRRFVRGTGAWRIHCG